MKSFFVRQNMNILKAAITLGIDLAMSVDYPEHFIITLQEGKMLLVPVNRWVVVNDDFVSVLTDEQYKSLYG